MPRIVAILAVLGSLINGSARAADSPEGKALAYLSIEVPRWSLENHCYSCHNNGDAARALYAAIQLGRSIDARATADTDRWLAQPEGWDRNGGGGPTSDKVLARVQFASALASALDSGRVRDRDALARAVDRMAIDQAEGGSWPIDEPGRVGSPATYGRPLATWMAREALRSADSGRFRDRIARADAWLDQLVPISVLDASTVLLSGSTRNRSLAFEILQRGQASDGGWGPSEKSPTEVFDTALAILALDRHRNQAGVVAMIVKGRSYLVANQQDDGSWTETTRPSGAESYAQRLSTSGWALLALLTVKSP